MTRVTVPRRTSALKLSFVVVLCLRFLLSSTALLAQTPPATANDALQAMAARAPVVFSGHVVSIDRADGTGYVDIRFRIEHAVRGCPQTGYYVLREWAGLWSGVERYRVGQHLLMLLHQRGPSGLSSPVNGLDGAIPIIPGGDAPLARGTGTAPADTASASTEPLVDTRWLNAETLRAGASPHGRPQTKTQAETQAEAGSGAETEWPGAVAPLPRAAAATGSSAAGVSITSVMTLLHAGADDSNEKTREIH